jgi:hypothetical protein
MDEAGRLRQLAIGACEHARPQGSRSVRAAKLERLIVNTNREAVAWLGVD